LEQSNAAGSAITVHCLNGGVEQRKAFSTQDSNLQQRLLLQRTMERASASRASSNQPLSYECASSAEILFADRKQKVEFQPALRLLLVPKQNHLTIN
jgi:hypothetical protein